VRKPRTSIEIEEKKDFTGLGGMFHELAAAEFFSRKTATKRFKMPGYAERGADIQRRNVIDRP
jgi:hypothetical protein